MVLENLSYMYPVYPILGFSSMILCLTPVPAHWRAGNIATISLALWTAGGLFICSIGTIIWRGNIRNPHPIWGDFVNLYVGVLSTAIASCMLCIQYRLWSIARAKTVFITKKEKQREKYATFFFCLGVPFLMAVTHYVVQGHRYNLWEDLGPVTEIYNVTLAFPLYYMWEPIICLISAIYSILTIRLFLARRKEFDAVLNSGSTNVNKDRYLRLLSLAAVAICIHLPLSTWSILLNAFGFTVQPWISWQDTHSNFARIEYITRFMVSTAPANAIYISISYWSLVVCGFNFFIFFGFGEEATRNYKGAIGWVLKPFGIKYPTDKKRKTIKKTWMDIILCRPGRPINLTSSAHSSSLPQFATNPSESRPSGRATDQTRTQTTTGGANDLNIDISNLDFLDPAEARKQARISAYTRPGQAAAKGKTPHLKRSASVDSSIHRSSFDGSDITDEKKMDDDASSPSTSTSPKVEFDLEAQNRQEPEGPTPEELRRREHLEKHPDLTEEVSF